MDEKIEVRIAKARIVPPFGFSNSERIIVDECPYCGNKHTHGAGGFHDNRQRMADCFQGEYKLDLEE